MEDTGSADQFRKKGAAQKARVSFKQCAGCVNASHSTHAHADLECAYFFGKVDTALAGAVGSELCLARGCETLRKLDCRENQFAVVMAVK